jgi:hypothetical protein
VIADEAGHAAFARDGYTSDSAKTWREGGSGGTAAGIIVGTDHDDG